MNKTELDELLADHQPFHSELQMDCFITGGNGGTEYGMYLQALRELERRCRALNGMYISRERLDIKNRRYKLAADELALKMVEAEMGGEDLDRTTRDTEREFRRFFAQAKALKAKIGELGPAKRAELELELWCYRLQATAAVDILSSGRLGRNTIEAIQALPGHVREPIWQAVKNGPGLVDWYERQASSALVLSESESKAGDVNALLESDNGLARLRMRLALPKPPGHRKGRQVACKAATKPQKRPGRAKTHQTAAKVAKTATKPRKRTGRSHPRFKTAYAIATGKPARRARRCQRSA